MKQLLLKQVAELTGNPDDGISREYVFDERYAAHRSLSAVLGQKRRTRLQFLLDTLEPAERKRLFPKPFDLGNMTVPPQATKAALQVELEFELKGEHNPEHVVRTIKEQIAKLAGYSFDRYFEQDPGNSLKVVKLLYLLNHNSPVRLFSLLTPPDGDRKPSLEVTDSYPLEENTPAAALLADLKALLPLEMSPSRRTEIDSVFDRLREQLDEIYGGLVHASNLHSRYSIDRLQKCLEVANQMLCDFHKPEPGPSRFLSLDEKLYLHCCGLEFLHYAKAQSQITTDLAPELDVQPIGFQLRTLSAAIQGKATARTDDPCIPITAFETLARDHADAILSALRDGLGYTVRTSHYHKAIPLAARLLRLWTAFHPQLGLVALFRGFEVDPLVALGALASVCHQLHHPTKYYPYWLGQRNSRGNVISALEKIDPENPRTTVPEEYLRYWQHQLEWFRYALGGQLSIYQQKLAITKHLVDAFEPLVRLHDTTLLRRRLTEYAELPAAAATLFDRMVD